MFREWSGMIGDDRGYREGIAAEAAMSFYGAHANMVRGKRFGQKNIPVDFSGYSDFFIVSREEALEQYTRAEQLNQRIREYLLTRLNNGS